METRSTSQPSNLFGCLEHCYASSFDILIRVKGGCMIIKHSRQAKTVATFMLELYNDAAILFRCELSLLKVNIIPDLLTHATLRISRHRYPIDPSEHLLQFGYLL